MTLRPVLLLCLQTALNRIKPIYDRYIVRDLISHGKELPMNKWFSIEFWRNMSLTQLLGVGSLALFKLFTFPLGAWIGSFSLVITYPVSHIIGNVIALIIHPLNLLIANKGLNEFVVNTKTMLGFTIVMVSLVMGAIGWYLICVGGNT